MRNSPPYSFPQEIELTGSMLRSLAKDTMAHTVLHPLKDATCILKFPVQQLQGATKKPRPRVLELNLAKVSIFLYLVTEVRPRMLMLLVENP
jgi:hypothetical protein